VNRPQVSRRTAIAMTAIVPLLVAVVLITGAIATSLTALRSSPSPSTQVVAAGSSSAPAGASTAPTETPTTAMPSPTDSPQPTPTIDPELCVVTVDPGIAKVGQTVRIEARRLTPGGPGEGLGSLHHDGQDVPLTFDSDGTYSREFGAGEWMANRQFNVRIVDLTNNCSTETILVVESAEPTPRPGHDCYISIDHVLPRVGERFVVEAHGLTPGGNGYGLGVLQPDGKDIPLAFSSKGTYRFEGVAKDWMVGEGVVRIHDTSARCNAFWVMHPFPADYVPPSQACWITVTPASSKSHTYVQIDGGGFTPNETWAGLQQLDGDLQPGLFETDSAGEIRHPLFLWWHDGEGIVEIGGPANGTPCIVTTFVTAVP
jgi:hypothetical protein